MRARFVVPLAVALIAVVAGGVLLATPSRGPATLSGVVRWRIDVPEFGGLSGLELTDDGANFTAVTDRGSFVTGRITRTDGVITGVADAALRPMKAASQPRLNRGARDAEGIAIAPDGQIYVSFEIFKRVWRYAGINAPAIRLPLHPDFSVMPPNGALEAVALGPDGALYTMPENPGRNSWPVPVYRHLSGVWDIPFALSRHGRFHPVGADFGPDGALYVLERAVSPFGFRSRIRRLTLHRGVPVREEILLQTPTGRHGNLEGLSVWRDDQGHIRLTMVSDDNFAFFLNTEFVEYLLRE